MKKISLKTFKIYDFVSKGALYLLVFLLPIFFLPWTINILDFNKQILLIVLVFISFFAWMLKVLVSGRFELKLTGLYIPIGVLFIVYSASTFFSLWRHGSFWGWPLVTSESLFTLIGLLLFYFLVSNIFKKKEIFYLIVSLVLSGFLVMIYGTFQLFGKFILPFNFTEATSFNTVGTVNALGLFAAVLLPLIIVLVMVSKRVLKGIFIVVLVLDTFLLILVNFSVCWWIVIVGSALTIILRIQKKDFVDNRWIGLPIFFLAIALFFNFFKFQVFNPPPRATEVYLNQNASFDISQQVIKEKPILGSGPGTFVYDFSKYKDITFNQTSLWNVRFEGAGSKFMTVLATTGILGAFSFLALIGFFILYGIKFLIIKSFENSSKNSDERLLKEISPEEKANQGFLWMIGTGIFVSFVSLGIGYFLYHSNLTLDFIFFLLIGSLVALVSSTKIEFLPRSSPLLALTVNFALTLIFIFGLGILILGGQRYTAEMNYFEGIKAWGKGESNIALNKLEKAASINPKMDLYWRELSQVYLQGVNIESRRTDLPQADINQRVQIFINNSVNSAKTAVDVNPQNVANWSVRGFIYQNLIGIVGGVEDWAVKSYEEALKLEPANPYYPTQAGIVLLRESLLLSEEEAGLRDELFVKAETKFKKAIDLKSDYAPARFQLAIVYQSQGKIDESIKELEKTKILAPSDVGLAFQLGLIYYQVKDYEKAQAEFERAIGIDPNYANALYFLGLVYDQKGEKSEAIESFRKVLDLNPGNEEVKKILENLREGKRALEGIIEGVPPTVPIEEVAPEELEEEEILWEETGE